MPNNAGAEAPLAAPVALAAPFVAVPESIFQPEKRVKLVNAPKIQRNERVRTDQPESARINNVHVGRQMGNLV